MKRLLFILLLVARLAIGAAADDQTGMGTLAGTVLDANGKLVAGASVTMQGSDGKNPHATITNAQGRFFFPELIHGYYDVRASHNGVASEWKHNIEVNIGKQTDVTLRLPAKLKK